MHLILAKKIDKIKIVVNGAGASAMACTNLFKKSGVPLKILLWLIEKVLFLEEEKI